VRASGRSVATSPAHGASGGAAARPIDRARAWLAAVLLALSIPATAAVDHLEFFDLAACTRGSVTSDFSIGPTGTPQHDADIAALRAAEKQAAGRWLLESAPRCYGFCRRTSTGIRCDTDSCPRFPLAGARFERVKARGSLPSYACVSGCGKGVPRMLHDLGHGGDGERNTAWEAEKRKMARTCGAASVR